MTRCPRPHRRALPTSAGTVCATLVLIAGVVSTLAGCGQRQADDPEAQLASVRTQLAGKDTRAAVIQLKGVLQRHPSLAEGRYLLGQAFLDQGQGSAASLEFAKALQLGFPTEQALPPMARALLLAGDYDKLIAAHARTDLSSAAAQADLKTSIATAQFKRGDVAPAEASLAAALQAAPDYAPARMLQARRLMAQGRLDAAVGVMRQLLERTPDDAVAWALQGELLMASPRHAEAAEDAFQRALTLAPDLLAGHVGVITLLSERGQLPQAQARLEAMKKALPDHPQTAYLGAVLAMRRNDLPTARLLADKLVAGTPTNPTYMRLAGAAALKAGDLAKAESQLVHALQLMPGDAGLRRMLVLTYLRSAQPALAVVTVAPLLEQGAQDPETLLMAGTAQAQVGNFKKAEALFAAARKQTSSDPSTRTALAVARLRTDASEATLGELRAIADASSTADADLALISHLVGRRQYDLAAKAIDALQRKQPGAPTPGMLRGQVALARGDAQAARAAFEGVRTAHPGHVPAYTALARLDLQDKQPDKARQRFEDLLQKEPRNLAARLALADLLQRTPGQQSRVKQLLAEAIQIAPDRAALRVQLVDHHLRQQDFKLALSAAQDGLAALPGSAPMIDALGRAHMAGGTFNQAVVAFRQLVAMQPKSPAPLMSLALAQLGMKETAAARQSVERALGLEPGYLPALQALIDLHLAEGRHAEALQVARQMQGLRPQEAIGYLAEGAIQSGRKQWDAAVTALQTALARESHRNDVAIKLHASLMAARRAADAERFAAQWRKAHPADAVFLVYLAESALARRDYGAAESQFQAVLRLDPDNAPVLNNLAWVQLQLRRPGALAHAQRAMALQPAEPAFMDTAAQILAADGQHGKAIELQRRAVETQPADAMRRLALAKLYLRSGDALAARAELDQLSALGERFPAQAEVAQLRRSL